MWSGTCSKIKNSIQTTPTIDHLWNCFHILTGEKSKRCHWHVVGGMKRWNIKEGNKEFRFANDFIPLRGAWGRMFTSFYPSCSTTGVPETGKIWFHKFCWSWTPFSPDLLYTGTSITIYSNTTSLNIDIPLNMLQVSEHRMYCEDESKAMSFAFLGDMLEMKVKK